MISKEQLIYLYVDQRLTQSAIGDMFGCDRKNVSYYLKKYGIQTRSQKEVMASFRKFNVTAEELITMVESGLLIQDIAQIYGVSRSTLNAIFSAAGLNFRNHPTQIKRQSQFMVANNPFNDEMTKRTAIANSHSMRNHKYKQQDATFVDVGFKAYAKRVRHLAYVVYGRGSMVPRGYVIDHMYSVADGYRNKIPPVIISHPSNLRLVTVRENSVKGDKSIISLDELYAGTDVQRLS
ncbi:hypothetical protein FACS1894184_14770 [Clostridia bacterium]|nr:hypothetical protein FACS1894184_14770 [Clostridia bacterium]